MGSEAKITMPLSELASIRIGHLFRGPIKDMDGGSVRVLQLRTTSSDRPIDWEGLLRTEVVAKREPKWLQDDEILVVARGPKSYAVFLGAVPPHTLCLPHFYVVRVEDERILPEFVAWQVNQQPIQTHFVRKRGTAAVGTLTKQVLASTRITIPPMEIQGKVIALAKAAQRERQAMQALIHNRERQMMAVARKILS